LLIEFTREYKLDSYDNNNTNNLWDFLTNAEKITACIPDLESLQIVNAKNFKGKIKPRFSFVKGKLNIECKIQIVKEGHSFALDIKGSSIGATFLLTMYVSIESSAKEATEMQVKVRAETFGLLKAIPKSLVQQVVEETEKSMLACIKKN
jgi:carbon monoxide dehydrogenase subunit G